jgi:hypothetical protein
MQQQQLQLSDAPVLVQTAYKGIVFSLTLSAIAHPILLVFKFFFPQLDFVGQVWFYVLLGVLWAPALIALIAGYISIIRYPDLSQYIRVREPIISIKESFVWPLLGCALIFVGFLASLSAFGGEFNSLTIALFYIGVTLTFNGYLLLSFDRNKHVVTSTFLDITLWFGIVLVPLYLPALFWGNINLRMKQRRLAEQEYRAEPSEL